MTPKYSAVQNSGWACRFALPLLALALLSPGDLRAAEAGSASGDPIVYEIVVTGGELLAGVYADSHTQFLTQTLHPLGLRCVGSISVDDKRADIAEALGFAVSRAKLVIVTGGLGPTENDITREALSEFTGIALQERPEVLRGWAERLNTTPDQLRPNLRRQAQVPDKGGWLKNGGGTAIGLVFEDPRAVIVALPGPPRELQPMVHDELVPYLSRRFGTRLPGCSLTLRFVGLGQSQISQTLDDNALLPSDVIVSSQFDGGRVDYTFALPDDTPQGRARLQQLKRHIQEHLGDHVYGEGTISLEEHIVSLLNNKGMTLALAEVGSGGSVAAALGGVEGARDYLAGAFTATTEEKLHSLLEVDKGAWRRSAAEPRLQLLAAAAAERAVSQWALLVGPILRDGDRRLVVAVFRMPGGRMETERFELRGGGDTARSHLTTRLLDRLRQRLQRSP
ncbi:MAG: hypothetical protein GXY83_09180 [Rhodopirellula sp.]|nr:hypothetical protein [Rhodopirellula sp.]